MEPLIITEKERVKAIIGAFEDGVKRYRKYLAALENEFPSSAPGGQ